MKSLVVAAAVTLFAGLSAQACQHLQPTSKPVPVVMIKDVLTGEEKDLLAEYKDNVKLVAFGNLANASFVEDIKAMNKFEDMDKSGLKRVVVIMDTKDLDAIKKFLTENEIKVRVVIPAKDDWQKEWPGAVNRAVFLADQKNIVAQGVDFIGNETLIREAATKLLPAASS